MTVEVVPTPYNSFVFPARAGMNRLDGECSVSLESVPRAGWDEPGFGQSGCCRKEVFPARAGMNR